MIQFKDGKFIGTLTVHKETEEAFKRFCPEFNIEYRCVKEGEDGDRWEVEFEFLSDIYALGQMVGGDALIEFQNRK